MVSMMVHFGHKPALRHLFLGDCIHTPIQTLYPDINNIRPSCPMIGKR